MVKRAAQPPVRSGTGACRRVDVAGVAAWAAPMVIYRPIRNPGPKPRSCRTPPRTRPPVAAVWGSPLQGEAASSNQHMEFDILVT